MMMRCYDCGMTARSCAGYVSLMLSGWIAKGMAHLIGDEVRTKWLGAFTLEKRMY
jgi:hypothetical protein